MSSASSSNNSESGSERSSSKQSSSAQSNSNSEQSGSQSQSQASSRSSIPSQILKGLEFDIQSVRLSQIGRDVENIAKDNNQFCNQMNRQVFFLNGYNYGQSFQPDRFGIKSLYQSRITPAENKSTFNTYGKYRFEEAYKLQSSPNKSIIKQNTNVELQDPLSEEKKCPQCLDRSIQANLSRAPTIRSIQDSTQKKPSLDLGQIPIRVEENLSVNRNNINNKSQKPDDLSQTNQSRFQIGKESQQIINNYYKQVQDKRKIMNNSKQQINSLYKHQIERNGKNYLVSSSKYFYDEYEVKKSRTISMYQDELDKYSRNRSSSQYYSQNKSKIDSRSIDIAIKTLLNK